MFTSWTSEQSKSNFGPKKNPDRKFDVVTESHFDFYQKIPSHTFGVVISPFFHLNST